MAGVNGTALGAAGAGVLFLYAGIKNVSVLAALRNLIKGTAPAAGQASGAAAGNVTGGEANVSGGSAQALLQNAAAQHGWTGAQWQALANVEMAEAGFNPNATNPSSGAYGLAQALGHGQGAATQGTVTNEYGGFGLSSAEAKAANSGDAGAQAVWMCNYIAATYGTPEAAWAHEQAHHWY